MSRIDIIRWLTGLVELRVYQHQREMGSCSSYLYLMYICMFIGQVTYRLLRLRGYLSLSYVHIYIYMYIYTHIHIPELIYDQGGEKKGGALRAPYSVTKVVPTLLSDDGWGEGEA